MEEPSRNMSQYPSMKVRTRDGCWTCAGHLDECNGCILHHYLYKHLHGNTATATFSQRKGESQGWGDSWAVEDTVTLLQKTPVWFSVPLSAGSQLPATPSLWVGGSDDFCILQAPGLCLCLCLSLSLSHRHKHLTHTHTHTHTHTQTHTQTHATHTHTHTHTHTKIKYILV